MLVASWKKGWMMSKVEPPLMQRGTAKGDLSKKQTCILTDHFHNQKEGLCDATQPALPSLQQHLTQSGPDWPDSLVLSISILPSARPEEADNRVLHIIHDSVKKNVNRFPEQKEK